MRVIIAGAPMVLKPAEIIGQGGEAVVYRRGARAVKIYQGLSPDALARKAAKLADYPRALPPEVLAPLALAHDEQGALVGYAMHFIGGALEGQRLSSKKQREGVLDAAGVTAWLVALGRALEALHRAGVVVGDLNDGNVLWAAGAPYLIDADSYQFGAHACTVAHERFLDPRLYGVDLERTRALSAETDWYAYAVLAFSVLLCVHPYGGTHPSLGTLMRRAEERVSVLRPEVTRPKVALSPELLPSGLRGWFEAVFDGGLRERLPEALLALTWTSCSGCGLEHARASCPACAARGVVVPRPAALNHGRVRWVPLTALPPGSRVRLARLQGGLRLLAQEPSGRWRREDGAALELDLRGASRLAFTGRVTHVGRGVVVTSVEPHAPSRTRTVGTLAGEAVFDANSRGLYYLDGDYLVDGLTETRVGTILEGATDFRVGERLGLGYYRAGKLTHHFLFRVGKPGLTPVALPPITGRLESHHSYFDDEHALVAWRESSAGRTTAHLHLVDAAGRVVASHVGAPEDAPFLAGTGGFALLGGRILRATDAGLQVVEVERGPRGAVGTLSSGATFVDAEPFVAEGYEILPGPAGSLYVVQDTEVGQLCLA